MTGGPFAGQVAVVTGAARGIGRAVAEGLAEGGAALALLDVRADQAAAVAAELGAGGATAVAVPVDLRRPDEVAAAVGEVVDRLGRIDVLVNNAAVMDDLSPVGEADPALWDRVLSVNLTAPFLLCHHVVPRMVAQGGGRIVNVASVAGLRGGRAGAAYTASKWGLVGLTRNVAATYGHLGVRCNALCPGSVATDINAGIDVSPAGLALRGRDDQLRPRRADPAEVAAAALFLLGEGASYVNGSELTVDGGYLAF